MSNIKHGLARTRLDDVYYHMIKRCSNPQNRDYHNYGGRGITVCDEWKDDKLSFFKWALSNGYSETLTLDRIDPDKGYSPENCRWADWYTQQNNRRNNRKVEIDGEVKTVAEWARISGVMPDTIYIRLNNGLDAKSAVFSPTCFMKLGEAQEEFLKYLKENGSSRCKEVQEHLKLKGFSAGTYHNVSKLLIKSGIVKRFCVHNGYHKGTIRYLKLS